jgi:molecular chaperone HscA
MAGDTLDSALVAELLERARLGADEELERRVRWALYQSGVRRLKEQLFTRGELRQRLINDQHVTITRDEFLRTERVQNFTSHLAEAIGQFLNSVDESWSEPMSNMQVVLTGGGSDLPMVRDLLAGRWLIRNTSMAFALSDRLPEFLMQRFGAEYPQLAVAIGGALPTILDEARAQAKWHGGAPPPGPLDRYQVTGL